MIISNIHLKVHVHISLQSQTFYIIPNLIICLFYWSLYHTSLQQKYIFNKLKYISLLSSCSAPGDWMRVLIAPCIVALKKTEVNEGAISRQVYQQLEVTHVIEYYATVKNWWTIATGINVDEFDIQF